MFHFNFNFEDGTDETSFADSAHPTDQGHSEDAASTTQQAGEPFSEIDLDVLLEALPPKISYTFITAPLTDSDDHNNPELQLRIARRDLFDARFQLISVEGEDAAGSNDTPESGSAGQGRDENHVLPSAPGSSWSDSSSVASALRFIDAPSDIVPLVYEGGLKTWECSLDLARCLKRNGYAASARSWRVVELGCGTAIPTLCLLQELFSTSLDGGDTETHIHLQDYNVSVLHLVTVPNIILAWYFSPAADAYRASDVGSHASACGTEGKDANANSELCVTPQLRRAFKTSLRDYRLRLRFFSGVWDAFEPARTGGPYHLVLTSETIYRSSSLPSLVRVMMDACAVGSHEHMYPHSSMCLVAAKTVYFGVGGGIAEFVRCIESSMNERGSRGQVETIWETPIGVSRKVMLVRWM